MKPPQKRKVSKYFSTLDLSLHIIYEEKWCLFEVYWPLVHLAKYRSEPAVDKKGKFVNKKTSTNSLIKKRNYLVKIGRNPDRDQEMKFEEDEDG